MCFGFEFLFKIRLNIQKLFIFASIVTAKLSVTVLLGVRQYY